MSDSDKSRSSDRSRSSPERSRDSSGRSRDSPGRSRGSPRPVPRQSSSNVPVNPKPFINSLTGQEVNVKLKWGMEYRGILKCADTYMNLQLTDAEEYIQHVKKSTMKTLLIRCNNILYVHKFDREAFEENERRLAAEKAQNNNTEE
ncbi:unnamed protein product [Larinioides sclopetarius]|uniref:Sm protein F n=1 Tax=Larinioides sclopetarius TaxID=280406 RepID=A0AAV2A6M5_9ARAC